MGYLVSQDSPRPQSKPESVFCFSVAKLCPTLCDPTNCSMPGFPVLHYLPEFAQWGRRWHPTPVLLPGKSHGWRSLEGCSPWGHWVSVTFTFHFHALEKEMATHSSVLAWRIPGTREPGGLPSTGSHRVGHDWSDLAAAAACSLSQRCHCILYRLLLLISNHLG